MKLIRVFPRKTAATPDDENARAAKENDLTPALPTMFDVMNGVDEVHVSVSWTWDIPNAEFIAEQWRVVAPSVKIGGPAYDDPGGEFEPGLYLKRGYVMTSRGCPNNCWFCAVPKREGTIREIAIKDGYNLLDSNILACSKAHIEQVFQMLQRQPKRPKFTGGLEAARLEPWHIEWLAKLKPETMYFAYDTAQDREPIRNAARMLKEAGLITAGHHVRCYVLCGWEKDTLEKAEARLVEVARLGYLPMAMLFDKGAYRKNDKSTWISFVRTWANPTIVGSKVKALE